MGGFTVNNQTHLILSEKIKVTPGDAFTVKDQNGNEVFKVVGKALSVNGKKTIKDAHSDLELYRVSEASVSLRDRQHIEDPNQPERPVLTLRKQGVVVKAHTVLAWAGPDDKGEPTYAITGGLREKEFDITDNRYKQVVGAVRKKTFTAKNLFFDDETNAITVEPGQDAALIVAIALAVDEIYD